jgi:subtilisin family serine protease
MYMKKYLAPIIAILLTVTGCNVVDNQSKNDAYKDDLINSEPGHVQYEFFIPTSEQDLMEKSFYGYIIVKTMAGFDESGFIKLGAEIKDSFESNGAIYYHIYKENNVLGLLNSVKAMSSVIYAEPDFLNELHTAVSYPSGLDDPYLTSAQYSYYITQMKEALERYGVGSYEVYNALVDTGINIPHVDLNGLFDHGYSMFSKVDNGDGTVTYTFVDDQTEPVDMGTTDNWDINPGEGHGSHVAGTIAAAGNNSVGVAGVCPANAKLIVYKCFAKDASGASIDGSGSNWAVYGSYKHLIDWKVANSITQTIPVNMSLGGSPANYFAIDMINYGFANDVFIISSSGNSGQNMATYPAGYAGCMAVGATNGSDEKVHFSTSGNFLSVVAPGYDIVSCGSRNDNDYQFKSGTSMAAPFVTGLATYMLTFVPTLTPAQIKQLIEENADDIGALGYDEDTGWGRVNVLNTIADVVTGNIPSSGSQMYTDATLTVHVTNTHSDVPEPEIQDLHVYLYDLNGNYVSVSVSDENGDAFFNMLQPGTYNAIANYYEQVLKVDNIVVSTTDVAIELQFNVPPPWYIQTLPNDDASSSDTDTVIALYDSVGDLLERYDWVILDTLEFPLISGQTYYIEITGYSDYTGHYGLYVSKTLKDPQSVTGADPLTNGVNDQYEPNDTLPEATSISTDTGYNAYLAANDADVFVITIP